MVAFSHDASLIAIGEGTEVYVYAISLRHQHSPTDLKGGQRCAPRHNVDEGTDVDESAGAGVGAAACGFSSEFRVVTDPSDEHKATGPDGLKMECFKIMNDDNLREILGIINDWWNCGGGGFFPFRDS